MANGWGGKRSGSGPKRQSGTTYSGSGGTVGALARRAELYGLTLSDWMTLLLKQEHKCAICKVEFRDIGWRAETDHDHNTGMVRGLLCGKCNKMLGFAKDCIETLIAGAEYLKQSRG
jgi:Recombination endonuclease VII